MALHRRVSNPSKCRRGAVAAQVTICLSVLLGIAAVTIDGGILQAERRRAQATADAAALAAAADLFKRFNTNHGVDPSPFPARTSALAIAAANGYTSSNSLITPNAMNGSQPQHGIWIPPVSGDHVGQAGYAEVVVQYNQKRFFSSIFGSGDIPVRARAVARGLTGGTDRSLLVLNPTANKAVDASGNCRVTVAGKITVNSSASNAFYAWGNSVTTGAQVDVVGSIAQIGNGAVYAPTFGSTTGVHSNDSTLFAADPLIGLAAPSSSGMPVRGSSTINPVTPDSNQTLQPGLYRGGITISVPGITMAPGVYYIERGNFTVTEGSVTSAPGGVMIYMTRGTTSTYSKIDLQVDGTVNLSPMSTGPYAGIMMFQDRNAPVSATSNLMKIEPATGSVIRGMIYTPRAAMSLRGNNVTLGDSYIVDTISLKGNSIISIPAALTPVAGKRLFGLVE